METEQLLKPVVKVKNWENICDKTYSEARWLALFEGVNCIAEKCAEKNIDWDTFEIKPLDLKNYINSMASIFQRKILQVEHGILVEFCETETNKVEEVI